MLLILLHACFVAAISLPLGWGMVQVLSRWAGGMLAQPPLVLVMLCGWALMTAIGAWLSLWLPLGHVAIQPGLVLLAALGWYRWPRLRTYLQQGWQHLWAWHWLARLLLLAVLLMAWGRAAMPGLETDEGLYYLPFIRWTQQFGVVPGLGNLHTRLAFNSHWHLLHALLDWPWANPLLDLNAYLCVLVSGFALGKLDGLLRGSQAYLDGLACLFLWPTVIWLRGLTSPIADLPLIYLTWLLGWWLLRVPQLPQAERRAYLATMTCLALWGLTIKLSGGLLLLLPGWLMLRDWRLRWGGMGLGLGALLVLPWLLRTYWLSGYLVYPLALTGWFHPDWQVPLAWVKQEVMAVRGWARLPGPTYQQAAAGPWSLWLPDWWSRVPSAIQFMLVLGPLYWVRVAVAQVRSRADGLPWRELGILTLSLLAMQVFWFTQAPAPRFGLGAISLAAFLPVAEGWHHLRNWRYRGWVMGLLCVAAQVPTFRNFGQGPWWAPPPAPPAHVIAVSVEGRQVWLAQDQLCRDQPLPCAAYQQQLSRLQWRGETMGAGFRASPAE
jgi:hypothetical protein